MKQSLTCPPPGEPKSDDPMELVGVSLPADEEAIKEMAYTFAEEFAQLGYGEERLLKLFRSPSYAAAHQAWQALGDDEILCIVKECVAVFGSVRFVVREEHATPPRRLPVLDSSAPPPGRQATSAPPPGPRISSAPPPGQDASSAPPPGRLAREEV